MLIKIKCDYDFKDEDKLKTIFKHYLDIMPHVIVGIEARKSSHKGFHAQYYLYFFVDEFKQLSQFDFIIGLRLAFGDDIGRCVSDIERHKQGFHIDKLFKEKNGKKSGNWMVYYDNREMFKEKIRK